MTRIGPPSDDVIQALDLVDATDEEREAVMRCAQHVVDWEAYHLGRLGSGAPAMKEGIRFGFSQPTGAQVLDEVARDPKRWAQLARIALDICVAVRGGSLDVQEKKTRRAWMHGAEHRTGKHG